MKIVFHKDYYKVYSSDPASAPGRLEAIVEEHKDFKFVEPSRATEEDIGLVHGRSARAICIMEMGQLTSSQTLERFHTTMLPEEAERFSLRI